MDRLEDHVTEIALAHDLRNGSAAEKRIDLPFRESFRPDPGP